MGVLTGTRLNQLTLLGLVSFFKTHRELQRPRCASSFKESRLCLSRGMAYFKGRHLDAAVKDFTRVLVLKSNHAMARYARYDLT